MTLCGTCSGPGIPTWVESAPIAMSSSCSMTGCAGIGKALRMAGCTIEADRTYTCCGEEYYGKGLLYEGLTSPPRYHYTIRDVSIGGLEELLQTVERCKAGRRESLLNPLGWPTLSWLKVSGTVEAGPGCVRVADKTLTPPGLEPLKPANTSKCVTVTTREAEDNLNLELGGYRIAAPVNEIFSLRSLVGGIGGNALVLYDSKNNVLTVETESKYTLQVSTGLAEHSGSVLAFFRSHPYQLTVGTLESPAVTIGLGSRKIAVGSKAPTTIEIGEGGMKITVYGSTRIALGGLIQAVRLAVEAATILKPVKSCGRGIGHIRVSNAVAVAESDGKSLTLNIFSPVANGLVELRASFPIREALVDEDCMGEQRIPSTGDLVRIPAMWGCCCRARIVRGLLMLGRKYGVPG